MRPIAFIATLACAWSCQKPPSPEVGLAVVASAPPTVPSAPRRGAEDEVAAPRSDIAMTSDLDPLLVAPDQTEAELDALGDAAYETDPKLALAYWRWASVARVARLHGRDFRYGVPAKVMPREALAGRIRDEIAKEYTPERLAGNALAWYRLGFTDESVALGDTYEQMLTQEIAGFYDPDTKELFLIGGETKKPSSWLDFLGGDMGLDEQKIILDHEVGHALQDQSFDLFAMQAAVKADDDAMLALTALVEGDAVVLMVMATMDEDEREDFLGLPPEILDGLLGFVMPLATTFSAGKAFADAPKIVQEQLLAPYIKGFGFAYRLWRTRAVHGDTIGRAFQAPPRSTEQILHPDRYLGEGRDEPRRLLLGEPPAGTVAAELVQENCVGEFGLRVLLERRLGGLVASNAAAGWDGDTYRIYQAMGGGSAFVVWASVWDDDDQATEFESAITQFYAPGGVTARAAQIARTGPRVAVVLDAPGSSVGLTGWLLAAREEPKTFAPSQAKPTHPFPNEEDKRVKALIDRSRPSPPSPAKKAGE